MAARKQGVFLKAGSGSPLVETTRLTVRPEGANYQ
jgi:hypothetical protein